MADLFQNCCSSALEISVCANSLFRCLKYLEEEGSNLHRRVPWKSKSQEPGYLLSKSDTLLVLSAAV